MADVKVPAVGGVDKRVVIAAGVGLVVVLGWKWYQASKASSSTTALDPNAIDPQTGLTYGAESLQAAGYVNPAPVQSSGSDTTALSPPTTDQDWVTRVANDLGGLGYDTQAVSVALSAYLSSQGLTTDQATIVRQAWAWEGHPPQHPGLNIIMSTTNSTPGGSSGVPDVPSGFSARVTGRTTADIWWHPVASATSYVVQLSGPSTAGGSQFGAPQTIGTTNGTSFTATGLLPGTSYIAQVSALNAAGSSAPTTPWHFTTTK